MCYQFLHGISPGPAEHTVIVLEQVHKLTLYQLPTLLISQRVEECSLELSKPCDQ